MTNSIVAGFKREYWEYKRAIVGLPILISMLAFLGCIVGMLTLTYFPQEDHHYLLSKGDEVMSFEFLGFYITVSWLAGIYYLLSCLHGDRKDKSILFWKSLPVSETQNVLTKLLVGGLGFAAIAVIVAWIASLILLLFWLAADYLELGVVEQGVEFDVALAPILIWPPLSMFIGFIWGAPVFTFVLMVSAIARRSPFLLLVVPLIVLPVLERMLLRSSYLFDFFIVHLPFGVLRAIAASEDMPAFFQYYFLENGLSLSVGLAVAALFTAVAIWCRNNRFEI